MSKLKITIYLFIVLIVASCVYYDQKFEPKNIDDLREVANAQVDISPPKEFTTDGCSLWFNSVWGINLLDICIEHDIEYWKGGNAKERGEADLKLMRSVNARVYPVGLFMYLGVRVFGHPIVPAPWRWGYGFNYPYDYKR